MEEQLEARQVLLRDPQLATVVIVGACAAFEARHRVPRKKKEVRGERPQSGPYLGPRADLCEKLHVWLAVTYDG